MTAPMTCPYCGGRGVFYHDRIYGQLEERCPDCAGSGEISAMVTIDWRPNIKQTDMVKKNTNKVHVE